MDYCVQPFLKDRFITDDVIKLDEEQFKPREWLSWAIEKCIYNQDSRIPYVACEIWSGWKAKFAHLACFFDYNPTTNELSLSDRSRSKLKSVLLIQHLNVDNDMLSQARDFGSSQILRNGSVITFKVPNEHQTNIHHKDFKLMVRFNSEEEDLNYAKSILERNFGSPNNHDASLPVDGDVRADDDDDSPVDGDAPVDGGNLLPTGTLLPATPPRPTSSEVIATPFLKKRAWIIHVPGSDEDGEKQELEDIARDLGGNITKCFGEAQYIIVSQEDILFDELVELLDTGLTSDKVREYIKDKGILVVDRSWLDDCAKDSSNTLSSPGERYTHFTQPLSSRKQKPKLDPSGRKPKNVSTPLVKKPATVAIPRQLVFGNCMHSSTTTNNNSSSNSDKDRRKSAPVGALKASALSHPGSNVPLLAAIKFKEDFYEEKVESLMDELNEANLQKEALFEQLKEKNHELDMYGYHQYETQEEHGAADTIDNDEEALDDKKKQNDSKWKKTNVSSPSSMSTSRQK
jgi:hypothetical protein